MKNNFFRKNAPVIPTGAKRSGGISRLTHNATIKATAHVSRFLGKLGMTVVLLSPVGLAAQNGVAVSNLVVGAGTVTFNVSWDKSDVPGGKAWVFVDYNDNGVMARLLVSGATASAGTAEWVNDKGAWVTNSENVDSFSATVTLSFTSPSIISGACVYASGYPPEAEYTAATAIEFTGTLPYDLVLEDTDGNTITRQSGNLFDVPPSHTLLSFTDKTGAPGIMKCIPPATFTLNASASGFCAGGTGVVFSLSNTESGKKYRLYRDGEPVGNELSGSDTGSATFTGGPFAVAGTYIARTMAEGLTCAIAMDGTHVVVENPLPADPTVNNDSRNCSGTVTLSASSSGALIDWYATADTASTFHTGASYTTPEVYTSTTYYVQARVEGSGCLSARVAVTAEVDMDGCCSVPGSTVTFTEFDPCVFATTNAVWHLTDTRAEGNNNTYKVSLLADGRIWMVQDLKFGACSATGTWKNDNSKAAAATAPTVAKDYVGHCRTNDNDPEAGYLYSWSAAMNNVNAYEGSSVSNFHCTGITTAVNVCRGICPEGWHLPTRAEYDDAHVKFGNNCDSGCWLSPAPWNAALFGHCDKNGTLGGTGGWGYYWTSTYGSAEAAYLFIVRTGPGTANTQTTYHTKGMGQTVRCILNYK
jgi:uncharacterized protein (TIGR02145 family)